jgi:aryl-alcohol dehydrogenase-like predicted oxidoreductase
MKLVLGTAQFGLNYGVSNTSGKTLECQVSEILDLALKSGIDTLDTARSYGDSEKVIGKLTNNDKWNIITKTPHFSGEKISKEQLKFMDVAFKESLFDLRKKSIDTLLFHSADDLLKPGGGHLFKKIQQLQESGFINKIGVSVYTSKQIDYILDHYKVDIIQLPISILDQRLIISEHLKKIKQYKIEIHARSVFLQGLLLMPMHTIPSYFSKIYNNIEGFSSCASSLALSNIELALGFIHNIDEIDKILIGVNTIDQLSEIIDASTVKINQEKYSNLAVTDVAYVNPSNWKL